MNVRAGVVGMRRARVRDSLRLQEGGRQLLGELAVGANGKKAGRSVDIDHRHGRGPPVEAWVIAETPRRTWGGRSSIRLRYLGIHWSVNRMGAQL